MILRLLLTLASLSLASLSATLPSSWEKANTEETNWGGLRATPFDYAYGDEYLSEPEYANAYAFNFSAMGIGDTWRHNRGMGSNDDKIVVAVIDTGIDIYHEDFLTVDAHDVSITDENIGQYSVLNPQSCYIHDPSEGSYVSSVVTDVGIQHARDDDAFDSEYNEYYSHGTATAACIGAAINGAGGLGVAPEVSLLIIRCDLYFTSMDVAIRYAVDNGASVINMSVGAYSETFTDDYGIEHRGSSSTATALSSAVSYAHSKDCVIVAAAGNEKTNHKSYPACNAGVIGVGALDRKSMSSMAGFSNFNTDSDLPTGNNNVDVVAPGYVWTANVNLNNGYKTGPNLTDSDYYETQGTSFASPLTAGAVALLRAAHPELSHDEVSEFLFANCDDIGKTGWDKATGYGRVNVAKIANPYLLQSVILTPEEANLDIGDTLQLQTEFEPASATNTYVLFESRNEAVAAVDEESGFVTAVGSGTATITCYSEAVLTPAVSMTVRVGSGGDPIPEPVKKFVKMTSLADLKVGDEYLFADSASGYVCGPLNGTYLSAISGATFNNGTITTLPAGYESFILGGSSGSWTLKQKSNGKLLGYNDKKLTDGTDNTTWAIGFTNQVINVNGGAYPIKFNSGSPRWKTYDSSFAGTLEMYRLKDTVQHTKKLDHIVAAYTGGNIYVGDGLTAESFTVTAYYTDPYFDPEVVNNFFINGYDSSSSGNQTITISYTEDGVTKTAQVVVNVLQVAITEVEVSAANKVFSPGETLQKSDITCRIHYNSGFIEATNEFEFEPHLVTYEDTSPSGALKLVTGHIQFNNETYDFTFKTRRSAYVPPSATNVTYSSDDFASALTGYTTADTVYTGSITLDNVRYEVAKAYGYKASGTTYLSFGKDNTGFIRNDEALAAPLTQITITRRSGDGCVPNLRISVDGQNYVDYSTSLLTQGNYRYFKLDYVGKTITAYTNIASIQLSFKSAETVTNLANYLMYEDTEGQCTSKLDKALNIYELMPEDEQSLFFNSNAYTITKARERLLAWAQNQGRSIQVTPTGVMAFAPSRGSQETQDDIGILPIAIFVTLAIGAPLPLAYIKRKAD